jgi:hypothetical protein
MIDGLIEIGRCHGMEVNVKNLGNENLQATIPSADYDKSTTGECGIFHLFG